MHNSYTYLNCQHIPLDIYQVTWLKTVFSTDYW